MPTRRDFLAHSSLIAGASFGIAELFDVSLEQLADSLHMPENGKCILFQGDSITDARRDRLVDKPNDPGALGSGYASYISTQLLGKFPTSRFTFFNRGVSGNKVFQLAERWQTDCLDIQPDIMTLLIGVNDYWHTFKHGYEGTHEKYEVDLRTLLHRTRKVLPSIKFILCEPFAIRGGTAIPEDWNYEEFAKYQKSVQQAALDFESIFIPFQKIFDKALKLAPVSYWCPDGVHPSSAGNYLMAKALMSAFKKYNL